MKFNKTLLSTAITVAAFSAGHSATTAADAFTEALSEGKAYGGLRLRYENVQQDNPLSDGNALTLRTNIGYKTGTVAGFSFTGEFEDSRIVLDQDNFNAAGLNASPSYSVVADPETTELDQAFVQYKNDIVTAKFGRQYFTVDDHRFVGTVGWRQDWQSFDALSVIVTPVKEFKITAAFLDQRNRIFAEARDLESDDIILNVAYTTPVGPVKGYFYGLELDDADVEALEHDTIGVSFAPKFGPFSLHAEIASQESENFEAEYFNLKGSYKYQAVNFFLQYEVLGSDDGQYGFSTPLATLHKFNGWSDQFLATPIQGLQDLSGGVAAKVGPGKLVAKYHIFSSDEDLVNTDGSFDDLGDELNLLYAFKFGKKYNAGVKYAMYSAGDAAFNKVDTDRFWAWIGTKF